ncbi:Asp/Glu/Hydantoin racemase [Shimia sp. SK013]|uniref:aspartate/glutamate racemase family protein n=1 Tax=Shimia sp. SK013 TaxID=1389006 RepID=UPI0006CD7B6D|nr:aspartate/glutamate racemase family protein [Shimia sp. SK013]KPA23228.1 Asp/Glu/Hydantoin racemase [Shimia sp. SK013]
MRVAIINPNSTEAMTEAMLRTAQATVPGLTFEGWTSINGPSSIQGPADGLEATPPLLEEIRKAGAAGVDGIIIGCFDDTALTQAAALATCPVIGIGQSCYHRAALMNWRFSVVTTLDVSLPVLKQNILDAGLAQHLVSLHASGVPVLALEADTIPATKQILKTAQKAEEDDGIDAVILGCAGMVHVTQSVRSSLKIPVLDPIETSATCMHWLLSQRDSVDRDPRSGRL